ncbi:MAG: sigma-70 family RNA polymerase sigma factor [Oscillospiraceae bacterium]|nr:sigma-70 family RNA polymerase sigma factor [Oscillospiraceae bacterium]
MESNRLISTVTSAQNGNEKDMEALYLEFSKPVYYLALKLLKHKEDAEDLTQEVFIYAFQKITELREPNAFPAWLNRITASRCTNFLTRKKQPVFNDLSDISDTDLQLIDFIEETDPLLIPEKSLDNAETARMIVEIIDNLPLPQRVCVYYYYYENLTIAQIAENLNTNDNTVKTRLSLAREKIRKELKQLEEKEGIKLYSVPLMLTPILKMSLQHFEMPAGLTQELWSSIAVKANATAAASSTTLSAAKGAIIMSTKVKILLAAAGLAVVGGVTAAIIIIANPSDTTQTGSNTPRATTEGAYSEPASTNNEYHTQQNPKPPVNEEPLNMVEADYSGMDITDQMLIDMVASGEIPANITHLDLQNNNITDISPLAGLTDLWYLNISNNNIMGDTGLTFISDLTPLNDLTNLGHLRATNNAIVDLSPLENLTGLSILWLSHNNIADISPLAKLVNLNILQIAGKLVPENEITDISPLAGLTDLENLNLSHNKKISDYSYISGLTNLTHLNLDYNEISDVKELSTLINIKTLSLNYNNLTDITPLHSLDNLDVLHVMVNNISDVEQFKGFAHVRYLTIGFNEELDTAAVSELLPDTQVVS